MNKVALLAPLVLGEQGTGVDLAVKPVVKKPDFVVVKSECSGCTAWVFWGRTREDLVKIGSLQYAQSKWIAEAVSGLHCSAEFLTPLEAGVWIVERFQQDQAKRERFMQLMSC